METTGIIGFIYGLYWGYIGIMENETETTIMENHMEKKMENEMEYIGVVFPVLLKQKSNYAIAYSSRTMVIVA